MNNITRSTYDRQYEHVGLVRHGVQTGPWRVEFDAPVYADDNGDYLKIRQGSVVSLNAEGKYVPGCGAGTTTNKPVPFISMKNITDPDVMTGYKGKTMADSTYSGVGGIITAIPCTSGYEIETTEFDRSATFAPNDGITAGTVETLQVVTTHATSITVSATTYTYDADSSASNGTYYGWKNSSTVYYTAQRDPSTSDKAYSDSGLGTGSDTTGSAITAVTGVVTSNVQSDAKIGLVVKATAAPGDSEPYLGFITKPAHKDYFNNSRIAFLTNFIPAGINI